MLTEEIIHIERKVERILEMSFDHTAAMLSLLSKEAQELKADSELHQIYDAGRRTLKANLINLTNHLEALKFQKGNRLVSFQHKCQEFGI